MSLKNASVLYVDDEESNLKVFSAAFRRYYNIVTARSGEEALAILEKEAVDLIVTDQRMPEMTGTDFLQKVKESGKDIPGIILTAYSDIISVAEAVNNVGIFRYFTKPWDQQQMRHGIDKGLESGKLIREKNDLLLRLQKINESLEEQVRARTAEIVRKNEDLSRMNTDLLAAKAETESAFEKEKEFRDELTVLNAQIMEQTEELNVTHESLKIRNEELGRAFYIIQSKNKQVMNSIRYAGSIQQTILPPLAEREALLGEHFIIYRPKDVVSGDFYWLKKTVCPNKKPAVCLAVVDCTGHGVPGAFMSIIGNLILNHLVPDKEFIDPDEILTKLHRHIVLFLRQNKEAHKDRSLDFNDDGMDVCLCLIGRHEEGAEVFFSGAKRPLFFVRQQSKISSEIKGTPRTAGGLTLNKYLFTSEKLFFDTGDMLYLSTDGYVDQANDERKRFGTRQFQMLMSEIAHLPSSEQKIRMEAELDRFAGSADQRDDITVLGLRI